MRQSYDHPTRTMGPQAGKATSSHWIGAPDLMTHRIICDVARDPIKATGRCHGTPNGTPSIPVLASSWFDVSLSTPAAEPCVSRPHTVPMVTRPHCWDILVAAIPAQDTHSNMSCILCWWEICTTDGLFDYLIYFLLVYPHPHHFSTCQEVWLSNMYRYQALCQIGWIVMTASCS